MKGKRKTRTVIVRIASAFRSDKHLGFTSYEFASSSVFLSRGIGCRPVSLPISPPKRPIVKGPALVHSIFGRIDQNLDWFFMYHRAWKPPMDRTPKLVEKAGEEL